MATYYRWNKYTPDYSTTSANRTLPFSIAGRYLKYHTTRSDTEDGSAFDISYYGVTDLAEGNHTYRLSPGQYFMVTSSSGSSTTTVLYYARFNTDATYSDSRVTIGDADGSDDGDYFTSQSKRVNAGTSQGYVYSTSSSAYPNGGVSGDYYYGSRTTITSPNAPPSISYPATITTPSVTVSWTAASSRVPSYSVNLYELSYSTNGGSSWTVIGTTASTSYSFSIPAGTTSIQFRVRARDSNNQYGAYTTGTAAQVILAPTLSVPEMVMQGQSATVSWSGVEGADSYTLERKSSADADWTQVYSGANLSYTETVGTWTSLQYRVCAVFGETSGGWATSGDIQIVAASALVISGSDGDLGTLTSDVSYSVSSDQTSPVIEVTAAVNGGEYAAFQAVSGQNYRIGVLDLPTGTGSIVITATTTVSESPVTVTRTWTYTKAAQSFPNAGSVARLTQEGDTIWPQTLAEAVRTIGGPWGGDLSKALNLLMKAALYNGESGDFSDLWGNDIPTVKIETGSYTGTGTYGASNPNTLTFSFEPKIVFISGDQASGTGTASAYQAVIVNGINYFEFKYFYPGSTDVNMAIHSGLCNVSVDRSTLKWYVVRCRSTTSVVPGSPICQLNNKNTAYRYVALG